MIQYLCIDCVYRLFCLLSIVVFPCRAQGTSHSRQLPYIIWSLSYLWFWSIRSWFVTLCKKCSYSELFWSVFSCIWTEYGEILPISPYSVRMRENTDQNYSEYGHFFSSVRTGESDIVQWFPGKSVMMRFSWIILKEYNLVSHWI